MQNLKCERRNNYVYIEGVGGVTLHTPELARRIVACVKACVGVPTETLETAPDLATAFMSAENARLITERDMLLAASKHIQGILQHPTKSVTILDAAKLDDAIANAERRA